LQLFVSQKDLQVSKTQRFCLVTRSTMTTLTTHTHTHTHTHPPSQRNTTQRNKTHRDKTEQTTTTQIKTTHNNKVTIHWQNP